MLRSLVVLAKRQPPRFALAGLTLVGLMACEQAQPAADTQPVTSLKPALPALLLDTTIASGLDFQH